MNTQTIYVLNSLIGVNHERIEGYAEAAGQTDLPELKNMFLIFQQNSIRHKAALVREVIHQGGEPWEGRTVSGMLIQAWRDIGAALVESDKAMILDACEICEKIAVSAYMDLINNNWEALPVAVQILLNGQYEMTKMDHDRVKLMLDQQLEHH